MTIDYILNEIRSILTKIAIHPFNQLLYAGTLAPEAFYFYLKQDVLYLQIFTTILKKLALKCDNPQHAKELDTIANYIFNTERKAHIKYLNNKTSLTLFNYDQKLKIPALEGYLNHQSDMVNNYPSVIGIASCFPCFWIYQQLGAQISLNHLNDNHPYKIWLSSYSSLKFIKSSHAMQKIFTEMIYNINDSQDLELIYQSCLQSVEFELQFFDAAYKGQLLLTEKEPSLLLREAARF